MYKTIFTALAFFSLMTDISIAQEDEGGLDNEACLNSCQQKFNAGKSELDKKLQIVTDTNKAMAAINPNAVDALASAVAASKKEEEILNKDLELCKTKCE